MRKQGISILVLIFVTFSTQIYTHGAVSNSTDKSELELILKKCADYCEKLSNVALFFVCQEEIKEEIRRTSRARRERNVYVYDYQLIRKQNEISERRILLEENGQEKHEKDAQLETKFFSYENIIFGPIDLLSKDMQPCYNFRIVKEEKIEGEKSIVIEAVPKPPFELDHLYGKIWVRKNDFSILKIEWKPQSIRNYENIEKIARRLGAKPQLTLISEYGFEKNGIRFPSKLFIREAYNRWGRILLRSKYTVVYDGYKFFTVETEVKH